MQHQAVLLADQLSVVKQLNGLRGLSPEATGACACWGGTPGASGEPSASIWVVPLPCAAALLERQGNESGKAVVTDGASAIQAAVVRGAGVDLLIGVFCGSLPWAVVAGRRVVWSARKGVLDGCVGVDFGSLLLLLVPLLLLVDDGVGAVLDAALLACVPAAACSLPPDFGGISFMQPTFS